MLGPLGVTDPGGQRLAGPRPRPSATLGLPQALLGVDPLLEPFLKTRSPLRTPVTGPTEGTQAGLSLMGPLLPSSSGNCETEEIVGSEIDVLGRSCFSW